MKKLLFLITLFSIFLPLNMVLAAFVEGTGHVKYYGFYETTYGDQGIPAYIGSVNVSITGPFTTNNPTQYVEWKAADGVHSIYQVSYAFFNEHNLLADYQTRWSDLAAKLTPHVANGSIVAFYLYDEPYGNWKTLGVSRSSAYTKLQTAARAIKASFPNTPIMVIEGRTDIDPQSTDPSVPGKTIHFPPEIDWVGFDCYGGFESCGAEGHSTQYYLDLLKSGMTSTQKIVLVPQIAYMTDANNPVPPTINDQNFIIDINNKYANLAHDNREVVAVIGYEALDKSYNGKLYYYGGLSSSWGNLNNKPVIDNLLGNGKRLLFQTSCQIVLPSPGPNNFMNGATTFTDNYLNASSDQEECMKRAGDFYNFWGVPSVFSGKNVTSNYLKEGVIIKSNTVGSAPSITTTPLVTTSCVITLPFSAPNGYANGATSFNDNHLNASIDKAQCMKRANDFYYFWGFPSIFVGKTVTSTFYSENNIVQKNVVGTETTSSSTNNSNGNSGGGGSGASVNTSSSGNSISGSPSISAGGAASIPIINNNTSANKASELAQINDLLSKIKVLQDLIKKAQSNQVNNNTKVTTPVKTNTATKATTSTKNTTTTTSIKTTQAVVPSQGKKVPYITSFSALPSNIKKGQSSKLSWNVTGASAIILSEVNSLKSSVSSFGNKTVKPAVTTTYTIKASNSYGSASKSVTITVK